MDYYWPTTTGQLDQFLKTGPWHLPWFFSDLAFGEVPEIQELYNMAIWTTPYIAAGLIYPGETFGLMRSAQVLAYGLTEAGVTGAVARTGGPLAIAAAGSIAQHKARSKHGAGTRGSMGSVSPSLHGSWLQTGLNINLPW